MTRAAPASMIISALLGSVSAISRELTTSDALLRSPLALSRRIGFVQLRGGCGTSSTAGYLASMLARRRAGMVLGVNASAGEANLLRQAGLTRSAARESRTAHRNEYCRGHPGAAPQAP